MKQRADVCFIKVPAHAASEHKKERLTVSELMLVLGNTISSGLGRN